jgi:adenylate cyclase
VGAAAFETTEVTPPLVIFSQAAEEAGFVTVVPDEDGGVRRIPLFCRGRLAAWPQFALALAADRLAGERGGSCEMVADARSAALAFPHGRELHIPLDAGSNLLINWRVGLPPGSRIPAGAVAGVWSNRQALADNRSAIRLLQLQLAVQFGQQDLLALFGQADELYRRRMALRLDRHSAMLFEPGDVPVEPEDLDALETRVEERISELSADLESNLDFLVSGLPADDSARRRVERIRREMASLRETNRRIRGEIAEQLAALRARVDGRLCLIGSNATGAADFVPTPMGERTPGVLVHANIFATLVTGRFLRQAPLWAELAITFALGTLAALLGTRTNALGGVALTAAAGVGYAALNVFAIFGQAAVVLTLWSPLVAAAAAFVVVTAYRQLTEEREKRKVRGMFELTMSPALVERLMEDPALVKLGGERRQISCLFSDLAGFTPLSERLGSQVTVQVLNRYFDRVTEVIQDRRGGHLNKFLGDGLFVFFGAPVHQDDHPARALQAALDCEREVTEFNRQLSSEFEGGVALSVRVGIATGEAMVGNCGSTRKVDYTAIGPTVNLASRLESANKAFGTGILVSESTWRSGGDGLLARPLGPVVVVGTTEPVPLYNVLCRREEADDDLRRRCERFGRAVELLGRRQFAGAAEAFEELLAEDGDDKAAAFFLDRARTFQWQPPPEHWDGAIHLTEK